MNMTRKFYEIRKTLVSKFAFSLEAELEADGQKNLYDEQFLIRMGKETAKLDRSLNKIFGSMIIIDTLLLLVLSGQAIKIKIFGNEIASFPGIIEIGLLLASAAYFWGTVHSISFQTYQELINVTLKKKNPKNNPEFFMGSLFSNYYTIELLTSKRYEFKSDTLRIVTAIALFAGALSFVIGFYALHVVAIYLGSIHILKHITFGLLTSKLIIGALLLVNFTGLLIFLVLSLYPFKFQTTLEDAEPD